MTSHHTRPVEGSSTTGGQGVPRLFVIALVIAAVYWLVRPENRTEAEDAFDFALRVREGAEPERLVARQLLFMPLGRWLVVAADVVGITLDAHTALSLVSLISTSLALVLFFAYLRRYRHVPTRAAVAATALLGATHGVWRYAAEADAYGLTILAGVGLLVADATLAENPRHLPAFLALGPLILSVNLFLAIPFAVLPATRLLMHRRPIAALGHVVLSIAVGVGTVVGWFMLLDPGTSFGDWLGGGAQSTGFSPSSLAKALIGSGQTVVSGTFAFGFPSITNRVVSALPLVNTTEEVFIGQQMDSWVAPLGTLTLLLVMVATTGFVLSAFGRHPNEQAWRNAQRDDRGTDKSYVPALLVWVALHAAILTLSNPTAPEPWIPLLLPVAAIAAGVASRRQRSTWWLTALALALALHTLVGGYAPVRSATTDYNRVRSVEFAGQVDADDLIVTFNSTYGRWLAYHLETAVVDLSVLTEPEVDIALAEIGANSLHRRVLVTHEVVTLPEYIGAAESTRSRIRSEVERWDDRLAVVGETNFGSLYELRDETAKP